MTPRRRDRNRSTSSAAVRAERHRVDQPLEPARVRLPRFDPEAFGRWSEAIARAMGTARFIVYMTIVIALWFGWNTLAPASVRFDPYTFTFLTLILSLQASYAAPLILLAQNRQADRDRLALEEDRRRAAMQKADTEYLAREIASLRIALGEVATRDFLRSELSRLSEDLGEAADRRHKLERKEHRRLAKRQAAAAEAAGMPGGFGLDDFDDDDTYPAGDAAGDAGTRRGDSGQPELVWVSGHAQPNTTPAAPRHGHEPKADRPAPDLAGPGGSSRQPTSQPDGARAESPHATDDPRPDATGAPQPDAPQPGAPRPGAPRPDDPRPGHRRAAPATPRPARRAATGPAAANDRTGAHGGADDQPDGPPETDAQPAGPDARTAGSVAKATAARNGAAKKGRRAPQGPQRTPAP
jgi:uncharacterized membrane protein